MTPSCCSHIVEGKRRGKQALSGLFKKFINPIHEESTQRPHLLYSTLGIRRHHMNFRGLQTFKRWLFQLLLMLNLGLLKAKQLELVQVQTAKLFLQEIRCHLDRVLFQESQVTTAFTEQTSWLWSLEVKKVLSRGKRRSKARTGQGDCGLIEMGRGSRLDWSFITKSLFCFEHSAWYLMYGRYLINICRGILSKWVVP